MNDPPVAQDLTLALDEDATASGALPASDVDNPALSYVLAQPPDHGTVSLNAATGAYIYTPARDQNGPDRVIHRLRWLLTSNVATVSLVIRPVNDPPVARGPVPGAGRGTAASGTLVCLGRGRPFALLRCWHSRRTTERSR